MQCRCCQNRSPVLWTQGRLTKQSWDHTCLRRLPQSRNPSSDRRPPLPWGTSPPHSQMPSKWQPNRPTSLCYRQTRRSTYPLTASNQSSHQDPCSMWVIPRPGHLTSTPENNCCTAGAKSERPRAPVTCPTGSRSICALCLATPVCKRDDLALTWVTIMVAPPALRQHEIDDQAEQEQRRSNIVCSTIKVVEIGISKLPYAHILTATFSDPFPKCRAACTLTLEMKLMCVSSMSGHRRP